MDFARDLLAQAKSSKRRDLVAQSKAYLDKVRATEDKKLSQALEKLGVDWSAGPTTGPDPELQLTLQTVGDGKIEAGSVAKLKGVVKNSGRTPAYRVRAVFESDNPLFDENEMVFGRLAPGESKSYEISVKVPASTFTRTDEIKATLYSQRGVTKATAADLLVDIAGKQRPMFAYSYQTIDDQKGANRDGLVQRGEQVRTLVTVKNIGQGKAMHTEAVLRNGTGQEGILITAGRFEAKDLAPGEMKSFSFVYEVGSDYKAEDYQLELSVGDTTLGETVTDKIKVKIAPAGAAPQPATGTATIARDDVPLRENPAEGSLVVGRAPKGATYKVSGQDRNLHARRGGCVAVRLRRDGRSEVGRNAARRVQARVGGDAARADGQRPDGRDGRHRAHQGARHRRQAGAGRLHPGLEPEREDPGEEGVLPAEPAGRRPHQDGLRRRDPDWGGQQPGAGVRARVERGAVASDRRRSQAHGAEPDRAADPERRAARQEIASQS